MNKYKADPVKLLKILEPKKTDPPIQRQNFDTIMQEVSANPNSAIDMFDKAGKIITARYDQVIASLSLPAWERKPPLPTETATPAGLLADLYAGDMVLGNMLDRYAREQAHMQMLGVHAAIRKYLWEYGSLPRGLADLKLGRLAIDPFNGQPFDYKRLEGTHYTLGSIGPMERNPKPGAPTGQRVPIQLP